MLLSVSARGAWQSGGKHAHSDVIEEALWVVEELAEHDPCFLALDAAEAREALGGQFGLHRLAHEHRARGAVRERDRVVVAHPAKNYLSTYERAVCASGNTHNSRAMVILGRSE